MERDVVRGEEAEASSSPRFPPFDLGLPPTPSIMRPHSTLHDEFYSLDSTMFSSSMSSKFSISHALSLLFLHASTGRGSVHFDLETKVDLRLLLPIGLS